VRDLSFLFELNWITDAFTEAAPPSVGMGALTLPNPPVGRGFPEGGALFCENR
jgi:hypothetical protein